MEARKGNKVYQVDEREATEYANRGFDIFEDGILVQHAKGKTVPIAEYEKLQEENRELRELLQRQKKPTTKAELIELALEQGIENAERMTVKQLREAIA